MIAGCWPVQYKSNPGKSIAYLASCISFMANSFFRFKQFIIHQDKCAMKVTTDACLFGALVSTDIQNSKLKHKRVLDIGSGTGLLALMFAQKNAESVIDAIEIDKNAADQAKENILSSPWKEKIEVINADARRFSFLKKYDLIISNPPFYEKEIKAGMQGKNIARHSEEMKLEELLKIIKMNLKADGVFYLLLPYKRNAEISNLLRQHDFAVLQMTFFRQSVHHDYFRIMVRGKLKTANTEETQFDEISVWDEHRQYTPKFSDLLNDYYL